MKRLQTIARLLLGAVFLLFGFDGLLHFVPLPPMPDRAAAFIHVLMDVRLFYAVKTIEILAAVLLLSGRYVSLAVCLLAPVLFNVLWFDANLDPKSLPVAIVLSGLALTLAWTHKNRFAPLLAAR